MKDLKSHNLRSSANLAQIGEPQTRMAEVPSYNPTGGNIFWYFFGLPYTSGKAFTENIAIFFLEINFWCPLMRSTDIHYFGLLAMSPLGLFALGRGTCDACSLRFTSGATPVNLLMVSHCSPYVCFSRGRMPDSKGRPTALPTLCNYEKTLIGSVLINQLAPVWFDEIPRGFSLLIYLSLPCFVNFLKYINAAENSIISSLLQLRWNWFHFCPMLWGFCKFLSSLLISLFHDVWHKFDFEDLSLYRSQFKYS